MGQNSVTATDLLRERVKELTCLYGIAKVVVRSGLPEEDCFKEIANLLPPAWLHSEMASARIIVDGSAYTTESFRDGCQRLQARILTGERDRGCVEVIYSETAPEQDEGPFLKEERNLIDAVAREIALLIERRESEKDKILLQEQLRHADRLATIGQLVAGVAHELNEPLGNILGFAQLAGKFPGLPLQVAKDLEKIATAALYAREVIRKLMFFARQTPPSKTEVSLNRIVEEALTFFEARCAKSGIELRSELEPDLPSITADPSQMTQVLVNLVVNSIQAMPVGGLLRVMTRSDGRSVFLVVEDSGCGMSPGVLGKIFIPFFTTKDVNEGTGLGLPVIHGIVTAHDGTITAQSTEGRGARFEIRLPIESLNNPSDTGNANVGTSA